MNNSVLISELNIYLRKLFPLNRSLTGQGNRKTLKILKDIVPLTIKEVPSGTKVYDWIVPEEWRVNDAWIKDNKGRKLIDFKENNLHLLGYSMPINRKMNFSELKKNLYLHETLDGAIPYRTSYYKKDWGFCLTRRQYKEISAVKTKLEVFIDSTFKKKGSLTYGEMLLKGKSNEEILISTYFCHPSLANDNLSGVLLTAFLARKLLKKKLNFSYRIIWVPETIGAIAYCKNNEKVLKKIDLGMVVTTVGGKGKLSYKKSWDSNHPINVYTEQAFKLLGHKFKTYPFDIHGSDERQYSSQGFRINTVTISKDRYYEYPEYHTSLDNLKFVSASNIIKSMKVYEKLIELLEKRVIYQRVDPYCETMLSKYNLYPKKGGALFPSKKGLNDLDLCLWVLFHSDGTKSTSEIASKIEAKHSDVSKISKKLKNLGILKSV